MSEFTIRPENPNLPPRRRRSRPTRQRNGWGRDLLIALAAGVAGVAVTVLVLGGEQAREAAPTPLGDRAEAALAALRESPVFVSPEARTMLSEEGERRVEEALAQAPVPVRVLVWRESSQDGAPDLYDLPPLLAEELAADDGAPGIVVLWTGPERVQRAAPPGWLVINNGLQPVGDAELRLLEFAESIGPDAVVVDDSEPNDPWGGLGGGILAGVLFTFAILIGVLILSHLTRAVLAAQIRTRRQT